MFYNLEVGLAQGVSFGGIIGSDTTWTIANSPYNITGNVLVNNGVTLTIEPGITVNLNGFYILVNGTLQARGTGGNLISFIGGFQIRFADNVKNYNATTGVGNIIEYANCTSTPIGVSLAAPQIDNCSLGRITIDGGSPAIFGNTISFIDQGTWYYTSASPLIVNNTFTGAGINLSGNSPIIANNTLRNGNIFLDSNGSAVISNNIIAATTYPYLGTQGIMLYGRGTQIINNTISGSTVGIIPNENSRVENNTFFSVNSAVEVSYYNTSIIGNYIHGTSTGIDVENTSGTTVKNNVISNNLYGIFSYSGNVTLTNNTLTNNSRIAIQVVAPYPILQGNMTIQKNTVINGSSGVDAALTYAGSMLIQGNLISNCSEAIRITAGNANAQIDNNTILSSGIALGVEKYSAPTPLSIAYNNFVNNQWNVHLTNSPNDLSAPSNWWDTTDTSRINQTLYDFKFDFNLGRVNFVPFLAALNSQATPDTVPEATIAPTPSSTPTPTPQPTASPTPAPTATPTSTPTPTAPPTPIPTPTPTIPEVSAAAVAATLLATTVAMIAYKRKHSI